MSETPTPPSSDSPATTAPETKSKDDSAAPKPAPSRARKWRRRISAVLLVIFILLIVGRASVSVLLPPVLRKVAGQYGLTAAYDRLDLYAMSGDVGLWNLRFTPLEGGDPVLQTSYCRASISLWGLVRGRLDVSRVESESSQLLVERAADGSLPLLERIAGSATPTAAPAEPAKPLSLKPPISIDVLRLQNAQARLIDRAASPATDVTLSLNLLVSDVGIADRKTRVELHLYSPQALAALYVDATAQTQDDQLDADLDLKLFGLNLEPARAYLATLGLLPVSNDMSAKASGTLHVQLNRAGAATQPSGSPAPASESLAVQLALSKLELTSNAQLAASVSSVKVDAPVVAPGEVRVASVEVDGVDVRAARSAEGNLRFAAIELGPAAPSEPTEQGKGPTFELQNLSVTNVSAAFDDAAVASDQPMAIKLSELTVKNLSNDPAHADRVATVKLRAAAPGLAKTFELAGEVAAGRPEKTLSFDVKAAGIAPTAAGPYLAPLGVRSDLREGSFSAKLVARTQVKSDGEMQAGFALTNVKFVDQDRTLLTLSKVDVQDVSLSADASRIRVGSADIEGPTLPLRRTESGELSAFGFTLVPAAKSSTTTAPTAPTTAPAAPLTQPTISPSPLPVLAIGKLRWRGADITVDDQLASQPLQVALQNLEVDIDDLTLDAAAESAKPGTVRVSLKSPGLVDQLELKGNVAPTGESVAFDLNLASEGMTISTIKPLLASLGIEPVMSAGQLRFTAVGSARQRDGALAVDLALKDASLRDGDTSWFELAGLSVANATFDGQMASIDAIQIDGPQLLATRDANGLFSAAGFKQLATPPTAKAVVATAPSDEPATPTQIDLKLPIVARLKSFRLNDAKLKFRDAAVAPAADVSAALDVTAERFAVGEDAQAFPYTFTLSSPGVINSLRGEGTLKAAPTEQSFSLDLHGTGIDGRALEPYLPPNIAARFQDGSIAAKVQLAVSPNPAGGSSGRFEVSDVALKADGKAEPIGALKALRVVAERVDVPGRRVAIDEVTLAGARLAVEQNPDGMTALGMFVASQPLREGPPTTKPAEAVASTQASDVEALMKEARVIPPLVTLKKLSLGADRLSLKTPALAKDLAITNLSLANTSPIELLGEDPTQCPPFVLSLKAGVEELIDSISLEANLAPLAAEPSAKLGLKVEGVHGEALTEFLPELAAQLDGQDLSDGTFSTNVDSQFKFSRRGVLGIDLSRDITATVEARDIRLAKAGVERPFASLDGIRVDRARYSPASGALIVSAVEITKPSALLVRDDGGIHVLGLTLKTQVAATQPTTEPAGETGENPVEVAAATQPAQVEPAAEQRIDSLIISGADILIEDRVGEVPTVLPINALDVEVKGLSSRALSEPNKPVRFSAIVGAGTQPMPGRGDKMGTMEERPVFAEASASGNVTLVPNPSGYMKLSLSGLEMNAIRGLASQGGIDIKSGTFDFRTDVRMSGATDFEARLYPTFNELRATEPPNGPVQSLLQLPTPLDVAIGTLEDVDGSITFPIVVPLKAGELDTGAVVGSAVGAVARVMGEAMVAAPLKAAKLGAMLFGADTSSGRLKPIPPVVLDFAPGESELSSELVAALSEVAERMRKDPTLEVTIQHVLSTSDVALAEQRSNPAQPDTVALVARLRSIRRELQQSEAANLSQVRVALASQSPARAKETIDAARATAVSLDETEKALDQVLELLRPGADRQTTRRTKIASLLLADSRLRRVQRELLTSGVRDASDRVRKANALFNPNETGAPGQITLTLTRRAKK